MCEHYPHLAKQADELCVIRSMHAESNNHGPALFQMQTGSTISGRPSIGSWAAYGLGTENENLPGFVVMMDHQGAPGQRRPQLVERFHAVGLSRRAVPDHG